MIAELYQSSDPITFQETMYMSSLLLPIVLRNVYVNPKLEETTGCSQNAAASKRNL